METNSNFHTVQDVAKALPYFMKLPIAGFRDPKYHCFVTTSHFKELINQSIVLGAAGTKTASMGLKKGARILLGGVGNRTINSYLTDASDAVNEEMTDSAFIIRLMGSLFGYTLPFWKYFFTIVLPRLNYALTVQFHGVQFVMQLRGLTQLKDDRINSFSPESEAHTILTPWEFILFNHPVHSATAGEVVNDYEDKVRMTYDLDFASFKPDDFLGNMVKIKYSFGMNCVYSGLKKHSMTVKVGDIVKPGQMIGRVGCSAKFPHPVCFFAIETPGFKIPIAGNMRLPLTTRKQLWDAYCYSPLLDEFDFNVKDLNFFEGIHPGKIQYRLTTGKLHDCSFVKQYPAILM